MGYGRRNSGIGVGIVLVVISVGLIATTGWLGINNRGKKEALSEIQTQADTLKESKDVLEQQVNALQVKGDQLTKQIEELNTAIQELKDKGIDVEVKPIAQEDRKTAYLTFDDGPSQNTIKILDFLKANNIQATFFVTMKEGYDDVYKRIVEEGHTMALHTATHDYQEIYQSVDTFFDDLNEISDHVEAITGVKSKIIRFPGGSTNTVSNRYGGAGLMDRIIEAVNEKGYVYYDWNVDSSDASKASQDTQVIVNSVLSQAKWQKEANILMHDAAGKGTTVQALPEIVEGLRAQGFVFRAINDQTKPVQFK